jgi:two-component system sensor histidine kinase HydH
VSAASSRRPLLPLVFGALTAAALVASVVLSWTGVHAAASTVARGDAQRAMNHVQTSLDGLGRPPVQADIDAIRAALADEGVVYLSVMDHGRELVSGTSAPGLAAAPPEPGDMDRAGETWRAVAMRGPPHGPHGELGPPALGEGPPPFPGDRPPHPFGPPRGPPPRIVVELVPHTALALEQRATVTLAVGVLAALLVVATSVALRRAAAERENALRSGERTKHLSSLGEMSAVLAHEIRNPLASLKGHAQLLEESLAEGTKDRAKAARVVKEALRIERLTTDLLAFVRSGTLAPKNVDPRAMVRAAIENAGDARVILVDEGAPAEAPLDDERVQGALENLLRNARDCAPEGDIEVTVSTVGAFLEIRVRDHGPGVQPGDEEKIFEPFHTTRVHGTGLGLSVSRRIAEAHGGALTATNAPDGGAVFTMRLALTTPRWAGG